MILFLAFLAAQLAAGAPAASPAGSPPPGSGDAAFRADVDRFFEAGFRLSPERATEAGDHRFDDRVSDLSAAGVEARVRHASMWREKFSNDDAKALSPREAADREWLLAQLDGILLRSRDLKEHERRPGLYLPTAAVYALVKRDFAPLADRMKLVTARETASLANFEAARRNLKPQTTPKVSIDIALQQMNGTVGFFKNDLPAAFASVPDGPDKKAFRDANEKVLASIASYREWLEKELAPRAAGRFAIGEAAYVRMLADDDMVDIPLPELESAGEAELERLLKAFRETAAAIDAGRTPEEVFQAISREHPRADQVIPAVAAGLEELRSFVVSHRLATIPSEVRPIVHETPPFARATSFASMDTPGPFEKATEAYFNVTLPDPAWPAEKQEQLLEFFSPANISDFSVHEVYPGHYVQFLVNRRNPDKVRSLLYSGANAEGWALYCEEMMLDSGLHGTDPKFRLAQIQAALQRACRYLAGIRMHTRHMSVEEAAELFRKSAFMTPHNAMVEALRGTQDPGYLRYQLGKLMILKLRDDLRRKEGAAFDPGAFHDRFLQEGAVPVRLIRRALLGSDGPLM